MRCPPNRVRRDQCDDALAFLTEHSGCTAEQVGDAIYPWEDASAGARESFANRRLWTLRDRGEAVRRREGAQYRWWVVTGAS